MTGVVGPTGASSPQDSVEETEEISGTDPGSLSYRQLVWRRFRKSKLAIAGAIVLALFYLVALLAEFIAPYAYSTDNMRMRYVPPTPVRITAPDGLHWPFVYALQATRDPETLELSFTEDRAHRYPVTLFHRGNSYRLFGLLPANLHLLGSDGPFFGRHG